MEEGRDIKGKFIKGHKASDEQELKRLIAIEKSIKNRKNYIGDLLEKCPKIYNSWRSFRFTNKGKAIGNSEEWNDFRTFFNDVFPSYKEGLLFRRLNTSKPFSKDNFIWATKEEAKYLKGGLIWLNYNGEELNLQEIALKYNVSLGGLKNRYHKRNKYNYTIEEIIFGRKKNRDSKIPKDNKSSRSKASKMISSYKHKDKINGVEECDIDIDWMLLNIINKPCIYCGDTNRVGCDRIDNTKGHTKDNVVPCCYECNCARNNNFTFEEMKIIGKAIKEVKSKRSDSILLQDPNNITLKIE